MSSDIHLDKQYTQSQGHGFVFENCIRKEVFQLPEEDNDIKKHDIPCSENIFDKNENISIKVLTGPGDVCCGSMMAFCNYNHSQKNTIIIGRMIQKGDYKELTNIIIVDYCEEFKNYLMGNLPYCEIERYEKGIRSIPNNVKGDEAKKIYSYIDEKNKLADKYTFKIKMNPKVSSSNSRLQCSFNLNDASKFITYNSIKETGKPNVIRIGHKNIVLSMNKFYSPPRKRGSYTKQQLIQFCRINTIKKYSKYKKDELVDYIKKMNKWHDFQTYITNTGNIDKDK